MPRKQHRLRRWGKWAGVAVCSVIIAAWCLSISWYVVLRVGRCEFRFGAGGIAARDLYFGIDGVVWHASSTWTATFPQRLGLGWPGVWRSEPFGAWDAIVPFWWLLLMLGIPTAYLWWLDRRPPPGHCRACGYNLTGNVSGVCPECGENLTRRRVRWERPLNKSGSPSRSR